MKERTHRNVIVWMIAALVLGAAAGAAAVCDTPRCFDVAVPVPAGLVVPDSTVRILLPAGYASTRVRYPVLYLLHGAGDTYRTWTEQTDVEEFSAQFPLVIVMPDGGHDAEAGWYSDWADGSRQWETFHMRTLVRYVDRHFRVLRRGHRAVAGLSMGGFGAMSYAARHRGLFRAAASFSGAVDTRYVEPTSGVGFNVFHDMFGTPDDRVWGNQVTSEATWREHNPTDRVADLRGVELFIATGTGTPGGPAGDDPSNPGGYFIEQVIFQMNLSFGRALDAAGVASHRDFYVGGYHGWPYWERELHWALPQIADVIRRTTR